MRQYFVYLILFVVTSLFSPKDNFAVMVCGGIRYYPGVIIGGVIVTDGGFVGLDQNSGWTFTSDPYIYTLASDVGIGTATPTVKLEISSGNVLIDNNMYYRCKRNDGTGLNIIGIDTGDNLQIGSGSLDDIRFDVGGNGDAIVIKENTGNLGVGTTTPVSKIDINGSVNKAVTRLNAPTLTLDATMYNICCDYTASGGTVTITLPSASDAFNSAAVTDSTGREYYIMDTGANSSANNITIYRDGSDTIITTAVDQDSVIISTDGATMIFTAISDSEWKQH